jgi:hypothetical protein
VAALLVSSRAKAAKAANIGRCAWSLSVITPDSEWPWKCREWPESDLLRDQGVTVKMREYGPKLAAEEAIFMTFSARLRPLSAPFWPLRR